MKFCTKCGNRLEPGLKFCTRCGAPIASAEQPAPSPSESVLPTTAAAIPKTAASEWRQLPTAAATQPASPPSQTVMPAANSKSGHRNAIVIVLAVLALISILLIGGVIYAGYKLKQKTTAVLHQTTSAMQHAAAPGGNKPGSPEGSPSDDPAGLLSNLSNMLGGGDDDGDLVQSISDKDPVEPCPAASLPSQSTAKIPLQPDTVVTTAWGMKNGDVESRNSVNATTPTSFTEEKKTEAYKDDDGHQWPESSYADTVCYADLASANNYVSVTTLHMPHLIRGVTRLRLSSKSFDEAKNSGKTTLRYFDILINGNDVKPTYEEGLLARVEPEDVPYPMIVNDQPVTLPAIHLAGVMKSAGKDPNPKKDRPVHTEADFYVIDDPLNPLVLMMKLKDPVLHDGRFRIEVVKLDYKTSHPVNMVEKQLTEQKRAITYGIYFDFNKDTIKPESEPVLKQIVQAMTDNPQWKLTVSGHTDNIGGDPYNLDLSKRRAAAVKQTLVTRYHIAPDRLSADGFGASSPIDTNDTLEGRARNRRVELTRE